MLKSERNRNQLEKLKVTLGSVLEVSNDRIIIENNELTAFFNNEDCLRSFALLSNNSLLSFDTLIDLCGIDYTEFEREEKRVGGRFCVVYHLLSTTNNIRMRVKVPCLENGGSLISHSVTQIWPAAAWYEREAFDLFGIQFIGNSDLRRLLTDYGFVGHPFRKDFPISGHSEVRYDPLEKRVVYQPVTIEEREIVPRVVRESGYGKEGENG